jgi:hypothetical protein
MKLYVRNREVDWIVLITELSWASDTVPWDMAVSWDEVWTAGEDGKPLEGVGHYILCVDISDEDIGRSQVKKFIETAPGTDLYKSAHKTMVLGRCTKFYGNLFHEIATEFVQITGPGWKVFPLVLNDKAMAKSIVRQLTGRDNDRHVKWAPVT